MPSVAHLDLLKDALAQLHSEGALTLAGGPQTQAWCWEDIYEIADLQERNNRFTAVFWTGEAHTNFDRYGQLRASLRIHWCGDKRLIARTLQRVLHGSNLRVHTPDNPSSVFIVEPTVVHILSST